ncbi:hypothetical protein N5079_28485 [Planotetraspora sp. A-T 1434]|nr:hypothetical protein [Planotetraspora sp. A-T 1434]MCT9934148.1 hypothetical protein [Planotetraspora sp. A-T 1434]
MTDGRRPLHGIAASSSRALPLPDDGGRSIDLSTAATGIAMPKQACRAW